MPEHRIIKGVAGKQNEKLLSTSLWPAGPAWKDLPGIARPDLPTSEGETKNKARVWDLWLTDYDSAFLQILSAIACSLLMGQGLMSQSQLRADNGGLVAALLVVSLV